MKNKTLKRLICFLLAFVVMVSLPLDLQANAVATETWMLYALITYLAGMGITFTVAGGVDAMIQAMEEKVKDYEQSNNIIDFYDYMRDRNVRFVPNNNQDPNGNPFFDLFFTASAVEAIQAFANWLTSDGGWGSGYQSSANTSTFTANYNGVETVIATTTGISRVEGTSYVYTFDNLGFYIPFNRDNLAAGTEFLNASLFNYYGNYSGYVSNQYSYFYGLKRTNNSSNDTLRISYYYGGTIVTNNDMSSTLQNILGYSKPLLYNIKGITFGYDYQNNLSLFLITKDDRLVCYGSIPIPVDLVDLSISVDIITPEELQEQFPTVDQGVSIKDVISVPMGDPSLIEWADRMEEVFIQTGTIPQPQPQVITDPDYTPPPTPAPTPVPTPEVEDIDDLGLPTLGEAIFNKFPFSLPKDLKRIADILNAEPVTPFWEVNLFETLGSRVPFVGDTTIRIDLAEYEALGQISRWASVITFVIFLVIITKGVIRW